MSKYQAYPEYKDSGVKWLGKIPASWSLSKMAWNFKAEKGKSGQLLTKDYCGLNPGKYAVYSGQTENNGVMGRIDSYEFDTGEEGVLFSTTVGAKAMHLSHLRGKFSLSQNCMIIVPITKRYQIRFSYYHFQPLFYYERGLIPEHMQASFRMEDLYQYPIALPSLKEQELIANFLDYETAKIDTLIDKQQQLIKLLKEKRQAVISHAVTKGLNPNAPMRESGVEWLGEVPEHWKIWKFRHIAPIITCGIASTPTYVDGSEGVAFLSAQNIRENKLSLHKYNYITHDLHEQLTKYRKPEVGDLLVTRVGAGIGEACVVNIDMEFSIYVSLTHIRVDPAVALNTFVMYFFGSDYCKYLNYQGTVTGGGVGNLNVQNVERYKLPLPNLEEQQKIVNYLDFEGERFSALIKKSELAIKLMQERRTALISAAVTGKIDVRHPVCHPTGDLQSSKSTVHGDL